MDLSKATIAMQLGWSLLKEYCYCREILILCVVSWGFDRDCCCCTTKHTWQEHSSRWGLELVPHAVTVAQSPMTKSKHSAYLDKVCRFSLSTHQGTIEHYKA